MKGTTVPRHHPSKSQQNVPFPIDSTSEKETLHLGIPSRPSVSTLPHTPSYLPNPEIPDRRLLKSPLPGRHRAVWRSRFQG